MKMDFLVNRTRICRLPKLVMLLPLLVFGLLCLTMTTPARGGVVLQDGTTQPKNAGCTIGTSNAQVYQNLSSFKMVVTFQVANTGTCKVKVATPSETSTPPVGSITLGGATQSWSLEVEGKGVEDDNKHAKDVLVAYCEDAETKKCAYTVKIISAIPVVQRR